MPAHSDYFRTFQDRRQCFADLLELSRRQLQLVETDDYPQLLGLLGGKQQILGRLEAISIREPRLWDEWRRERDRVALATRQAGSRARRGVAAIVRPDAIARPANDPLPRSRAPCPGRRSPKSSDCR